MKSNRRKKMASLLISMLLFVSAVSGCGMSGSRERESARKSYVAIVVKSTDSAFWKAVNAGAGAAATEYNLDISFEGPKMEEDYETQNELIEKAVEKGAQVLIVSAVDYNANSEAVNRAAEKGVKIIVVDSDVNSSKVSCHIGTDNDAAGEMAGRAILRSDEKELHIGIVNYDINSANGQQRERGFRRIAGKDARVKSMYTINVVSTTEDAKIGTEQLLEEHPEINAIATFNEWTSLGVGWAIREMNLAEETYVVAFDSNVVSVGMMETGEVDALIVQKPYAMGYLAVEKAYRLLKGQDVEEKEIDTATMCVTRDNMFTPQCQRLMFAFE